MGHRPRSRRRSLLREVSLAARFVPQIRDATGEQVAGRSETGLSGCRPCANTAPYLWRSEPSVQMRC